VLCVVFVSNSRCAVYTAKEHRVSRHTTRLPSSRASVKHPVQAATPKHRAPRANIGPRARSPPTSRSASLSPFAARCPSRWGPCARVGRARSPRALRVRHTATGPGWLSAQRVKPRNGPRTIIAWLHPPERQHDPPERTRQRARVCVDTPQVRYQHTPPPIKLHRWLRDTSRKFATQCRAGISQGAPSRNASAC
jgi:hypothetical protein